MFSDIIPEFEGEPPLLSDSSNAQASSVVRTYLYAAGRTGGGCIVSIVLRMDGPEGIALRTHTSSPPSAAIINTAVCSERWQSKNFWLSSY